MHAEAFRAMKENFMRSVCLSHVIPGAQFNLQTDACILGIGGYLYQYDEDGRKCIISIASRCLTVAESRYTTTELELLTIVYCVEKFRNYLIGTQFKIITDHKSLTFFNSTTFHNSRLIRWSLLLQQYSYTVSYCWGTENKVADFLSRNPNGKFQEPTSDSLMISSLHAFHSPNQNFKESSSLVIMALHADENSFKKIIKDIKESQIRDENCKEIVQKISENGGNEDTYQIYREILFHRENKSANWRIIIPIIMKDKIIEQNHNKFGHPGVYKTLAHLKKFYYWKSMNKDVKKFVLTCDMCQRVKYLSIAMEGPYQMVRAEAPSDLVTVDFFGPLPRGRGGAEYIFVVLDAFSKLVRLYPMKKATTAMSLKKIVDNYIPECGKPDRLLSDNGTQFTSAKWKNTLEKEGIKVIYSSIRHPQSNPTERVMREIGRLLRTYCSEKHTSWVQYIKTIENLLNITKHYTTECTPIEVHFGKPLHDEITKLINFPENAPISKEYLITLAKKNIEKNFAKRTKNQKASKVALKNGDYILLRVRHMSNAIDKVTKKLFYLFEGPYIISRTVDRKSVV